MVTANDVGDKGGKQESQQEKAALEESVACKENTVYSILDSIPMGTCRLVHDWSITTQCFKWT